jgi:malonate-semialdehyde dehydrogenase (acetylating) / methylmalonate-semialdehyde dehydrogenase
VATQAGIRTLDNYVGGGWVRSGSPELLDVGNPATGELLARVPLSTRGELDEAVAVAREAFWGWRSTPVIRRAQWLFALRQALHERRGEIAASVTREMGKTLPDAEAEVARMVEMVECATAVPTTMQGRVLEGVATGIDAETIRQPVGVCAAICPFNFPAMVPWWFIPFALACGNTFVLKPSEQVPLTQTLVFETVNELGGLPPGVLNLVHGGRDVVEAILDSPGIDAVSFVGSAPVARMVYERAAAAGKRVQALGGAKNHIVVMPDAVMDDTVANIVGSAFGAAGQRCMAGSVVVAVGDAKAPLMERLVARAEGLRVGDGMDPHTNVGPVVSRPARDSIRGWIDRAVADGARLAVDGREPGGPEGGSYVGPTILDEVTPGMAVVQEEVFGPVLCIVHAGSLGEAIEIVNGSRFGNGTSIFTESGAAVRRFRHDVQVGMVGVNIGVAAPVAFFPFSGWKDSFLGDLHAHGPDAVEFFTRKKTVTSRYFSGGETGRFFTEHGDSD